MMWGRYWGDKHSHGYRDPGSSSRRDGTLSSDVAQTVMSVEVSVMEGSWVHRCCRHGPVVHTAADQSFTGIEHGAAHETAPLRRNKTRTVTTKLTPNKSGRIVVIFGKLDGRKM